jgi:SAM-dependent methyltransferase
MNIHELIRKSTILAYERPLEYLFLWSNLIPLLAVPEKVRSEVKILDVGGAESLLSKTLAELGFDTYVIDINDVDAGKAKFIKANIFDYDFPENMFNIIISISTIEHVGLPCYGQTIHDRDGDIKTMHKIYKWLAPEGIAIITLPYGKQQRYPPSFARIYDENTLKNRILISQMEIIRKEYICCDGVWRQASESEAKNYDAAVLLLLRKSF